MADTGHVFILNAEDGGTALTGTHLDASCAVTLEAAAMLHGAKGYKCFLYRGSNTCDGYYNFSTRNDFYARAYIRFPSSGGTPTDNSAIWRFMIEDSGVYICGVRFSWVNSATKWGYRFHVRHNSGLATVIDSETTGVFSLDTTYRIECRYLVGSGTGGGQLWIDGVSAGSNFTYTNTNYDCNGVYFGNQDDDVAPAAQDLVAYFDDIVGDTSAIGAYPEGGSVVPQVMNYYRRLRA